jgi:hypothetical protein
LKASLSFFEGCKACLLTIESRNYNNADASFEAFANAASKRRGAYRRGTHEQIKKTLTKALQAQMQAQVVASPLSRAERLLINGQEKKAPGGASERGSTEMSHESPNSSNSFKSVPSDGGRGAARDNKRGSALSKFSSVASTLGEEQGELNEESNEDEDQEQEDDSSVHMINYAEIKAKRRSVVNLKKGPLIPVKVVCFLFCFNLFHPHLVRFVSVLACFLSRLLWRVFPSLKLLLRPAFSRILSRIPFNQNLFLGEFCKKARIQL